jgi:ATPase subunit of ABC transporter with duplicated ATPase domains
MDVPVAHDTNGTTVQLGHALTAERPVPFGLRLEDRRFHTYVVGKTGTGKSTLLATIARQDLEGGQGFGLIDPHGDLAEQVLSMVPEGRLQDVLYFNPADAAYRVGFNILAAATPEQRPLVASGVVSQRYADKMNRAKGMIDAAERGDMTEVMKIYSGWHS